MKMIKSSAQYDVAGIGSALLDFTVEVEDAFLEKLGLSKGEMQLVDEERSREILDGLKGMNLSQTPGGSAANTVAGVAIMGGNGIFFGAVASDENGKSYVERTIKGGVSEKISRHEGLTGHAITFITPDSERTFATHLGAAIMLDKSDIDGDIIKKSKILHIEGYLFEPLHLRDVCFHAIDYAKKYGTLISVDLSDPALIGRIHDVFKDVVGEMADIIFVNEDEARAFTGLEKEDAADHIAKMCDVAVVKLGASGSMVKSDGRLFRIPPSKTSVINTNGAGDMFAAGILYGISRGFDIEKSGKIGSYVSSMVVSQVAARLEKKINIPEKL